MRNPFPIVMDQYAAGAEQACLQLLEKTEQGSLPKDMLAIEQDLLKASFAFLAMEFVAKALNGYEMEDFQYFIGEMQLEQDQPVIWYLIGKAHIPWKLDYEEEDDEVTDQERFEALFQQLLQGHYRQIWKKHLFQVLGNEIDVLSFFQEVVMEGASMSFEEQSKGLDFIHEL